MPSLCRLLSRLLCLVLLLPAGIAAANTGATPELAACRIASLSGERPPNRHPRRRQHCTTPLGEGAAPFFAPGRRIRKRYERAKMPASVTGRHSGREAQTLRKKRWVGYVNRKITRSDWTFRGALGTARGQNCTFPIIFWPFRSLTGCPATALRRDHRALHCPRGRLSRHPVRAGYRESPIPVPGEPGG